MTFKKQILLFAITFFCLAFSPNNTGEKQKVEIVFCLDLSASTNGLVNDIRDNLWHFINSTRLSMPEHDLRIGIIGFARPSFGVGKDYVKVLSDFTEDYDLISYGLFQLKVNVEKGDQCDGSALYAALTDLHWSQKTGTKRLIYLFGNGKVNMCGYDYRSACDMASKNRIPVHAVYCVQRSIIKNEIPGWNGIATLTGGNFYTYPITKRTPLSRFSSDAQWLVDINQRLQDTYIYFSKDGQKHFEMMCAADDNSKRMNEQFFYARCRYKLTEHYINQCKQWDLVSLMFSEEFDFSKINREDLPENYQKKGAAYIKSMVLYKKERREFLLKEMHSGFTKLPDTVYQNPIDSIFLGGLDTF